MSLIADRIKWGIIGCGDVTEVKSGPAFNKVPGSSLVAVMRRNAAKAEDYAKRHQVPVWYSDALNLINDKNVNAVYIATPPSSHKELTLLALKAGKPVYVEKPMTTNAADAKEMTAVAKQTNMKLSVAHYRRAQPKFKKVQQLLREKAIGEVRLVQLNFYRKQLSASELSVSKTAWRVDPAIAGGGLFYDIAPHQLDIMFYYFGEAEHVQGFSANQSKTYNAPDIVSGQIHFKSGVFFSGTWCFAASALAEQDEITIIGSAGKMIFSAFGANTVTVITEDGKQVFSFDELQHVQQPMIEQVVNYFLDKGANPSSGEEGVMVMDWLEKFSV